MERRGGEPGQGGDGSFDCVDEIVREVVLPDRVDFELDDGGEQVWANGEHVAPRCGRGDYRGTWDADEAARPA